MAPAKHALCQPAITCAPLLATRLALGRQEVSGSICSIRKSGEGGTHEPPFCLLTSRVLLPNVLARGVTRRCIDHRSIRFASRRCRPEKFSPLHHRHLRTRIMRKLSLILSPGNRLRLTRSERTSAIVRRSRRVSHIRPELVSHIFVRVLPPGPITFSARFAPDRCCAHRVRERARAHLASAINLVAIVLFSVASFIACDRDAIPNAQNHGRSIVRPLTAFAK